MPSLKPRTASVVIYQGDDLARLSELRRAAEVARRRAARTEGTPLRMGDAPVTAEAEEVAYDAFVAEAAERAVEVEVRAIGRRRFRDLLAEHPPREVEVTETDDDGVERVTKKAHPDDDGAGVNVDSFPDALLDYSDADVQTIVAPDFRPAERRRFLDDELSEGDFETLWATAYALNRSPSSDPKASLYSPGSPMSTET